MSNNVEKPKVPVEHEKLACFFFDLAKLTFAGLVIGMMVNLPDTPDIKSCACAALGAIGTIVFARIGFLIINSKL